MGQGTTEEGKMKRAQREKVNAKVKANADKDGSWDDLMVMAKSVEEVPITIEDKCHIVKYQVCSWERQNQITIAIMRELGPNASRWEYERQKQEKMIRAMVIEIDGVKMDEAKWLSLPYIFGEYLRMAFFMDTGEYADQLRSNGVMEEKVAEILKSLKDGIVASQEKELKN